MNPTVENHTTEITTISYLDSTGDYLYLERFSGQPGAYHFSVGWDLVDALDISDLDLGDQLKLLYDFQQDYEDEDCRISKIKVVTTRDDLTMDDDDYKELRQRIAFEKLNESDIRALGLMSTFTYIKTKYHEA